MSNQEREGAHNHPPDGKKLPTGTCKATNPELKEKPESQLLWNNWCDEVCVESDYGGLGADACVDGSPTGAVAAGKAPAAAAPGAASPAPVAAVPVAPVD